MNKYVVSYGTGEYDDYSFNEIPVEYSGSKEELHIEFKNIGFKALYRHKIIETLKKLKLCNKPVLNDDLRYIKIGNKSFNYTDFIRRDDFFNQQYLSEYERYEAFPPQILTLDEWFYT